MAHILVVDSSLGHDLPLEGLHSNGHSVTATTRAEQALSLAKEQCLDVVLMNIRLPGLDGLEAARRLKAGCRTSHITVIAIIPPDLRVDKEVIFDSGFDGCLGKPLQSDLLLATVTGFLVIQRNKHRSWLKPFDGGQGRSRG